MCKHFIYFFVIMVKAEILGRVIELSSFMAWEFGNYIKRLMVDKGWNQADLARESKLSPAYVGFILKGETAREKKPPNVSVDVIISLSEALDVPEAALLAVYKGKAIEDISTLQTSFKQKDFRYERILLKYSELLKEVYPDENTRTKKIIEILQDAPEPL